MSLIARVLDALDPYPRPAVPVSAHEDGHREEALPEPYGPDPVVFGREPRAWGG